MGHLSVFWDKAPAKILYSLKLYSPGTALQMKNILDSSRCEINIEKHQCMLLKSVACSRLHKDFA